MKRLVLISALVLLLNSCGPIIGHLMTGNNGMRDFQVREGDLSLLRPESAILVYGPFAKTDEAFYICRGEDAARFAEELEKLGFVTELYIERSAKRVGETADRLRSLGPGELREELGLDIVPDLILFGTLLRRDLTVAPAVGIEMEESYRLDFHEPATGRRAVVEVAVEELAERTIPAIGEEIGKRLAAP